MKQILITSVLIVLSILEANADETHMKFLQLRTAAEEAQNAFYAAVRKSLRTRSSPPAAPAT